MKKKCERTSRKEGQGSASKVLCTRPAPDEAGEKKKNRVGESAGPTKSSVGKIRPGSRRFFRTLTARFFSLFLCPRSAFLLLLISAASSLLHLNDADSLFRSRILLRRVVAPRRDLALGIGMRSAEDQQRRRRRRRRSLEQQTAAQVPRRCHSCLSRLCRGAGRRGGSGYHRRRALCGQDRRPQGAAEADCRHHRRELGPGPRRHDCARQKR